MPKTDKSIWSFEGKLCKKDAEKIICKNGKTMVKFTVAINKNVKKADGTFENQKTYADCVWLGDEAATCFPNLCKGVEVSVEGDFRQTHYTSPSNNITYTSNQVFVNKLNISAKYSEKVEKAEYNASVVESNEPTFDANDIPF